MRVTNIGLDGEELPETITVELSRDEAIVLGKITGKYSFSEAQANFGERAACTGDIYDALVGVVFNRFWDDGIKDAEKEEVA